MVDFERRSQAPQHRSRCGANAMSLHSSHCALGNAVDNLGPIFELRRKVENFFLKKMTEGRRAGMEDNLYVLEKGGGADFGPGT
jgi:hypothetical protein